MDEAVSAGFEEDGAVEPNVKPDPVLTGAGAGATEVVEALLLEPKEKPDDAGAGAAGVELEAKAKPLDAGAFVSAAVVLVVLAVAAGVAGFAPKEKPEKGLVAAAASAPVGAGLGAAAGVVDVEPKAKPANGEAAAGAGAEEAAAGAPKEIGALGVVLAPKLKVGAEVEAVDAGAAAGAPKEKPPKAGLGTESAAGRLDCYVSTILGADQFTHRSWRHYA